ncbi:uncharacterized protein (TIGR02453 family) [Pontibacter aydingkolensis]|uniref:DUF2461 domain-containing protein n=1 Tax=Pontibacter aydingkolensis TaxID=1911536 RepID=A0ABS7CSH4_9BACT|nr:DUF2461 domain-containing protein [Pontibacter aydingkolensis]MBW7466796.1 DUF2461 domain-containing protein [Pontibacter aydingkolensis]
MAATIDKTTLDFLADLTRNNNREWFNENKKRYETARKNYIQFLDEMLEEMAAFEPVALEQKGKDLVFRIYRDVRFSNDKRPYKDHFGAYVAEGGRKSIYPGYYLHLAANNNSFVAGGLWMPPSDYLKAVRQEIDYSLDEFKSIVEAPDFKKRFGSISGEQLKTTPKGYDKENPAIEYLRFKSWNAVMPINDKTVLSAGFMNVVLDAMKALKPFYDFLMEPLKEIGQE